nr:MAG TPA: hypothetical protein [Caudoviricetes sp.]
MLNKLLNKKSPIIATNNNEGQLNTILERNRINPCKLIITRSRLVCHTI